MQIIIHHIFTIIYLLHTEHGVNRADSDGIQNQSSCHALLINIIQNYKKLIAAHASMPANNE